MEAAEARFGPGGLVLTNVNSARPGGFAEHSDSLTLPSDVRDPAGLLRVAGADQVSFWDLPGAIQRAREAA